MPPENSPKDTRVQKHAPRQRREHDQEIRILVRGRERERQRGAPGRRERKGGLDDRLHGHGRHRVRVLVPGRVRKGLADALEDVDGDLGQDVHLVRDGAGVGGGAPARPVEARTRAVDELLDAGDVRHGRGFDDEANEHAVDGREGELHSAEGRVDDML